MADYQEFLDGIDREAYHEGEWQWQEDGYTVTRTYNYTAPGCHDACGLLFYVKDGKLEKVEGDPLDPCANGKLCMRCLNLPEMVNHPDRVKYPMRRVGERGENKWERISWEEAMDWIEEEVKKIDDAGLGRESIYVAHGTGRNVNWQTPFLGSSVFGTPNCGGMNFPGYSCYMPRSCGTAGPMGDFFIADASMTHPDRYNNPEWVNPEVVVVWACEPNKSNADGYLGHWLVQCVQMGTKIISIDPVLTWWGARAEYWLPIRPATDLCLALAWLNVIIGEDLYDHEFVDNWCAYFEPLAEHVKKFTPEWAAEICQVPAEDIIGSARMYAAASAGAIQWGLPFDTQLDSMHVCMAVLDIAAVTGNIDNPGGNVIVRNSFEINPGYALSTLYVDPEVAAKKLTIKMHRPEVRPFIATCDNDALLNAMEDPSLNSIPYPIKMVFIAGANYMSCMGMDPARYWLDMKNVDFCVVADYVFTPTAVACADLVLPIKMSCERDSMRVWWTPLRAMKQVTDFYEAVSDEEMIVKLGNRLNPELFNHRWPTIDAFLQDYLDTGFARIDPKTGKGLRPPARNKTDMIEVDDVHSYYYTTHNGEGTFMKLVEQGGYEYDDWNNTYYKYAKGMLRYDGSPGFLTQSGRIELIPPTFRFWGINPFPDHVESEQLTKWLEDPEYKKEYPFILITGARSYEFFHSEHRQQPTMREFHPEPLVQMNPAVGEEYGLIEGDWIWLENEYGRCMQKVKFNNTINREWLSAEHGWWFPEQEGAEPNLFGTFTCNVNNLQHMQETGEGGVGSTYKNSVCKIYKVQEGDIMPGEQVTRLGGFRKITPGQK